MLIVHIIIPVQYDVIQKTVLGIQVAAEMHPLAVEIEKKKQGSVQEPQLDSVTSLVMLLRVLPCSVYLQHDLLIVHIILAYCYVLA